MECLFIIFSLSLSLQKLDPLERSELIAKIEGFEQMNHPNGIDSSVEGILKVLNEQRYYKEAYNEIYEQLLHGKTVLTQEL